MATNFPTSADNGTTLPDPTGASTQNSPDHASLHATANGAIKAIEAKVGTGASTPTANTFLFGTGVGTSAWTQATSSQVAAAVSDETGTGSLVFATTPTLVTPKVDTINENTPANGVTIDGLTIKDGALLTANSTPPGSVVQVVSTNFSAVATGTTVMPQDDTIPQITEGDQYMTQVITPKSTTNQLLIEVIFTGSISIGGDLVMALFQDATASALAATAEYDATATSRRNISLRHNMTAGTVSATTFRFRAGPSSAGTLTFNGASAARIFGGVTLSNIKITEYKA